MDKPTVGVAVITHNAKHHLTKCLPPYLNSRLSPRVVVVNSSSSDGTVEEAKRLGAETLIIPRKAFNHGLTRERARKYLNTEVVCMVTPDAYPETSDLLERLIEPILSKKASIAYARQISHKGAGFFEAFPRYFNYPEESHIRGYEDREKFGVYTFFCSDSCSAYLNATLDAIGGFPSVLLGEDTVVTAKALLQGHKIAYVADAVVRHSHAYSLVDEFKRHFDTGMARRAFDPLLSLVGSDSSRGREYVSMLFKTILFQKPYLLPYATLQTASKWLGYRIGKASLNAPLFWKRLLSSQDFFWVSDES